MSSRSRVTVVVVSWNTRDLLARCLRSVEREAAAVDAEIEPIVVDNGSSDDSAAMVAAEFPGVRLIARDDNPGFAAACNVGIRAAESDAVLLLNPDTELRPDSLARLLDTLAADRVGIVGARLLNPDLTLQPSCSMVPTVASELLRLFFVERLRAAHPPWAMGKWPTDEPREVEVVQGACMLVRRALLDDIGLLDERYFMYSEEVDLCARAGSAGWKVVWEPRATVIHAGGQSTRIVADRMFLELYRSKVQLMRKLHGALGARAYKLALATAAVSRIVIGPVLSALSSENPAGGSLARRYTRLLRALPRY